MSSQNLKNTEPKTPKVFPKCFCGTAKKSFENFLKKNNYNYNINYISSREDLVDLIELYSSYKNYTLPVIISDISFLSKKDQSLLLKFMDDTDLNLILLASRDNILDTIISRIKEFKKFYVSDKHNQVGFINTNKAREMFSNELNDSDDLSYDDKLIMCSKYNPVLSYDDYLVKSFSSNDKNKLLNLLEFSNER